MEVAEEKIIVTGGAGFIGSELARQLADQGHQVMVVDNLINIRFGTQIAINAVVLPRVVVGYESLIGASAVVTKDVPALSIVMGVPGRVTGRVPPHLRMPEAIRRKYYNGQLDPVA